MIAYHFPEEREVALIFAAKLGDEKAKSIIERGHVSSATEARHLANFFWRMVNLSAQRVVQLPFEGSSEYWTEKLLSDLGGYVRRAGYGREWEEEGDRFD